MESECRRPLSFSLKGRLRPQFKLSSNEAHSGNRFEPNLVGGQKLPLQFDTEAGAGRQWEFSVGRNQLRGHERWIAMLVVSPDGLQNK